jgi:hypothetical protein
MTAAEKKPEVCVCGVRPYEDTDDCRRCDGTGDDEADMFWPGCAACGGRSTVTVYHCDCDPYGDDY